MQGKVYNTLVDQFHQLFFEGIRPNFSSIPKRVNLTNAHDGDFPSSIATSAILLKAAETGEEFNDSIFRRC